MWTGDAAGRGEDEKGKGEGGKVRRLGGDRGVVELSVLATVLAAVDGGGVRRDMSEGEGQRGAGGAVGRG